MAESNKVLLLVLSCTVFSGMALAGCLGGSSGQNGGQTAPTTASPSSGQLEVVTSFRAITLLVAPIAGNDAKITQILPAGEDPHDYDPTPSDAKAFLNSPVFFYDGPTLEKWGQDLATSVNPNIKLATFEESVPASAFAQIRAENSNFPNSSQDMHYWLSPQLALYFAPYVAQQLSAADPAHSSDYQANARAFEARLQQLDSDYKGGLADCRVRNFLTSHAFLDYVAAAYNVTPTSITGLSPDATPSIQQMADVINESRAAGVLGVLAEPDETVQLSNSVAAELNLPTYPFTTMEVLPQPPVPENQTDYIGIQEGNLHELELAMDCSQGTD